MEKRRMEIEVVNSPSSFLVYNTNTVKLCDSFFSLLLREKNIERERKKYRERERKKERRERRKRKERKCRQRNKSTGSDHTESFSTRSFP